MRVLVIGSGGPVGRAIVTQASAAGAYVVGASRRKPRDTLAEHKHVEIDRAAPSEILNAVKANRIDVVIDVVAYTLEETQPLLLALDGAIQRYVLISSCDVYRNYGLLNRKEHAAPALDAMDESAPLRQSRYPYRATHPRSADSQDRWMDNYDKIPIEEAVSQLKSDWTILRLPMVFGAGDKQRRFQWVLAPMLGKAKTLEVPERWANWVTTYGYIDNVTAAVVHAASHPRASGAVFNIGDYEPVSHRVWIDRFRTATGWNGTLIETSSEEHPIARATAMLDLTVPLKCSTKRIEQVLSFRPPIDLRTTIDLTVRDEIVRG